MEMSIKAQRIYRFVSHPPGYLHHPHPSSSISPPTPHKKLYPMEKTFAQFLPFCSPTTFSSSSFAPPWLGNLLNNNNNSHSFFLRIQSIPVIFYRCCIVISFSSCDQQQPQTVATVTSSAEDRKIHYPLFVFRFRSTYCMANNRWMMYSCFVRFGDTFLPPPACPLNDSSFLQWIIYQREIHIVVSVQPSGSWKPPSNAAVIVVHQLPGIGGWNGRRIHIHKFLFL